MIRVLCKKCAGCMPAGKVIDRPGVKSTALASAVFCARIAFLYGSTLTAVLLNKLDGSLKGQLRSEKYIDAYIWCFTPKLWRLIDVHDTILKLYYRAKYVVCCFDLLMLGHSNQVPTSAAVPDWMDPLVQC